MRTLIDLTEDDIAALDREARRRKTSRAAVMREAIAEYIGRREEGDDGAFGVWKKGGRKPVDGLVYQEKMRREW